MRTRPRVRWTQPATHARYGGLAALADLKEAGQDIPFILRIGDRRRGRGGLRDEPAAHAFLERVANPRIDKLVEFANLLAIISSLAAALTSDVTEAPRSGRPTDQRF